VQAFSEFDKNEKKNVGNDPLADFCDHYGYETHFGN